MQRAVTKLVPQTIQKEELKRESPVHKIEAKTVTATTESGSIVKNLADRLDIGDLFRTLAHQSEESRLKRRLKLLKLQRTGTKLVK